MGNNLGSHSSISLGVIEMKRLICLFSLLLLLSGCEQAPAKSPLQQLIDSIGEISDDTSVAEATEGLSDEEILLLRAENDLRDTTRWNKARLEKYEAFLKQHKDLDEPVFEQLNEICETLKAWNSLQEKWIQDSHFDLTAVEKLTVSELSKKYHTGFFNLAFLADGNEPVEVELIPQPIETTEGEAAEAKTEESSDSEE
jgi:hypothetical protein